MVVTCVRTAQFLSCRVPFARVPDLDQPGDFDFVPGMSVFSTISDEWFRKLPDSSE